jgi:hypothetical protein
MNGVTQLGAVLKAPCCRQALKRRDDAALNRRENQSERMCTSTLRSGPDWLRWAEEDWMQDITHRVPTKQPGEAISAWVRSRNVRIDGFPVNRGRNSNPVNCNETKQ